MRNGGLDADGQGVSAVLWSQWLLEPQAQEPQTSEPSLNLEVEKLKAWLKENKEMPRDMQPTVDIFKMLLVKGSMDKKNAEEDLMKAEEEDNEDETMLNGIQYTVYIVPAMIKLMNLTLSLPFFRSKDQLMSITREQTLVLEKLFETQHFPCIYGREEIANRLKLSEEVVRGWFKYRREGSHS